MSTEKELAVSHPGFWERTLPLSEAYVRTMNRSVERFAVPMASSCEPARRGLVNEAGFRLFAAARATNRVVSALDDADVDTAWSQAARHVRTMRQYGRSPIDPTPRLGELPEAIVLATRIASFVASRSAANIVVEPTFPGCGWVDEARGDVLTDNALFEVKAGERRFRSIDLHQLLTYCALNFVAKSYDITNLGLVNPRWGTFIILDLDDLCTDCAGTSTADVLDEIVNYISEPLGAQGV